VVNYKTLARLAAMRTTDRRTDQRCQSEGVEGNMRGALIIEGSTTRYTNIRSDDSFRGLVETRTFNIDGVRLLVQGQAR